MFEPTPTIISRRAKDPGREILQHPPSVMFSFRTVTKKRIDVFSRTLQVCVPCQGVCCIVF